ncbi:MAG: hypothetical protein H7226_02200 [Salinibacterium sp.]|nr:hypothetical protein [Salinibacterium sp.]
MRRLSVVLVVVGLLLSGCASSSETQYPAATLQAAVLAVSDASAAGDPSAALTRLDELQASLLDERARGTVDQARFDSVSAAIELVRTDLERAIAEQAEVVRKQTEDDNRRNSPEPEKPGKPEKDD